MQQIIEERRRLAGARLDRRARRKADWKRAKRLGFGDAQLAALWGADPDDVRDARLAAGVAITYKTVDTCAAEFEAEHAVPLRHLRGRGRGRAAARGRPS